MDNLRPDIKEDYSHSINQYKPSDLSGDDTLSEVEVVKAHYLIADFFASEGEEVYYGVKNFDLLSSAVNRQYTGYAGIPKWTTPYQKMATLFYGLNKNHAFHDGNKRTALLSLLLLMYKNHLVLKYPKEKLEVLCLRIAANELSTYSDFLKYLDKDDPEVNFIADLIKKMTRKQDKHFHSITFMEFNRNLNRFGVKLDNPDGNYIDVLKREEKKVHFYSQKKENWKKVFEIGFPGWKRQVNPKALKEVLKVVGLTAENGYDSEVFYYGAEPSYKLIQEYREPLLRLRDN